MRILFLAAANSIHTIKWVNSLSERNHEVYLVYNTGHDPDSDKISEKVRLFKLPFSGNKAYFLNAFALRKVVKKLKPEVINVHYASGYGTLSRLARIKGTLLSVWGSDVYDFPYESSLKKKILQKNVLHAEKIASTSYCMAEQLRKVMDNPKLDIYITPFGVDTKAFNPDVYLSEKEMEECIVIGNIKTLKPKYGIKESILVFKKLIEDEEIRNSGKKILFKIYGDGKQKEELEQLIHCNNLDNRVTLEGRIPNVQVPEILDTFDIFFAFSQNESFGVSIVEAMAMKVPVVVSEADGFKEVVSADETGYIVPGQDMEIAKDKLKKLVLSKELRKKMGEAGRKHVLALYDWEENVTKMEKIYYEVLQKRYY